MSLVVCRRTGDKIEIASDSGVWSDSRLASSNHKKIFKYDGYALLGLAGNMNIVQQIKELIDLSDFENFSMIQFVKNLKKRLSLINSENSLAKAIIVVGSKIYYLIAFEKDEIYYYEIQDNVYAIGVSEELATYLLKKDNDLRDVILECSEHYAFIDTTKIFYESIEV